MSGQQLPQTPTASANGNNNLSNAAKAASYLISKKSLKLKVTFNTGGATVEVFACPEVNLRLAEAIARVQERIIQSEILTHIEHHRYGSLLAIFDRQGWSIQQVVDSQ